MQDHSISEASKILRGLAHTNAQVYAAHPHCRAIILTGSAAEGVSDYYSDLDLIVYYDRLPHEKELLQAVEKNQGQKRTLIGEATGEEMAESYRVNGVECQVAHSTIAAWEQSIEQVHKAQEVASPLQKALAGMLEGIPLYGEPLVHKWKTKIAAYPDELAEAMVRHYLSFFPLWGLQERLASRDATIWSYQVTVENAQHLLGVLAGLNRQYYSTFQFKRTQRFIESLTDAPNNLAERLERVFKGDPHELEQLVSETLDLLEQKMPQIETSHVRRWIGWRQQSWQPVE